MRAWLPWILGLGVAICACFPILSARWGAIDDHEIATFLGPDHNLPFTEIPGRIAATEAGHPGGFSRYRPSYFTLRVTEAALWGAHPEIWYAARIVFLAIFLGSLIAVLAPGTSLVEALAFAVLVGTADFWRDIYFRLGPGEAYGALGVGLFAVGFARALQPRPPLRASVLLAAGALIAMGSKENLLLLALPAIYLGWRQRNRRGVLVACLVILAFALFVAVSVYLGVRRHGHVYAEDVSSGGRLRILGDALMGGWNQWSRWWLVGLLAWAAAWLVARLRGRFGAERLLAREGARTLLALVLLLVLHASQVAFYNGQWPPGPLRYLFPGALVAPLMLFAGYRLLVRGAGWLGLPSIVARPVRVLAALAALWLLWPRFQPMRAAAEQTVRTTRAFTASIEMIARAHRRQPSWPIVFASHDVWDFEFIHSVQLFLYFSGVDTPAYLTLDGYSPASFAGGSLEAQLTESLATQAAKGLDPPYLLRPWARFAGPPCYGLGFSGAPPAACESLGVVPKP